MARILCILCVVYSYVVGSEDCDSGGKACTTKGDDIAFLQAQKKLGAKSPVVIHEPPPNDGFELVDVSESSGVVAVTDWDSLGTAISGQKWSWDNTGGSSGGKGGQKGGSGAYAKVDGTIYGQSTKAIGSGLAAIDSAAKGEWGDAAYYSFKASVPLISMVNPALGLSVGILVALFKPGASADTLGDALNQLHDEIIEEVEIMITERMVKQQLATAGEAIGAMVNRIHDNGLYVWDPIGGSTNSSDISTWDDTYCKRRLQFWSDTADEFRENLPKIFGQSCTSISGYAPAQNESDECKQFCEQGPLAIQNVWANMHLIALVERGNMENRLGQVDQLAQVRKDIVKYGRFYSDLMNYSLTMWVEYTRLFPSCDVPEKVWEYKGCDARTPDNSSCLWIKQDCDFGSQLCLSQMTSLSQMNPYTGESIPEQQACEAIYGPDTTLYTYFPMGCGAKTHYNMRFHPESDIKDPAIQNGCDYVTDPPGGSCGLEPRGKTTRIFYGYGSYPQPAYMCDNASYKYGANPCTSANLADHKEHWKSQNYAYWNSVIVNLKGETTTSTSAPTDQAYSCGPGAVKVSLAVYGRPECYIYAQANAIYGGDRRRRRCSGPGGEWDHPAKGRDGSNQTAALAAACDGKEFCSYKIDVSQIGDPCAGTPKSYTAHYTCCDGLLRTAHVSSEASGQTVNLTCQEPCCSLDA